MLHTDHETLTQDRIQSLAYTRWQNAGSPIGDALCFWLTAEKEITHKGMAERIRLNDESPHVRIWP